MKVVVEAGSSLVTSVVGPLRVTVSVDDEAGIVLVAITVEPATVTVEMYVAVLEEAVDWHEAVIVCVIKEFVGEIV